MPSSPHPKVSVILPVYNGERYLAYALGSILHQTLTDFELLIINDGSSDGSENVIAGYSDQRIRYIKQQNIGLTGTLNRLIQEARGELLARMDQDDWSHPERLQLQFDYLRDNPDVKMCGSWIQAIDTNNQFVYTHRYPVTNHAIQEEMLLSNPFAHGSVMIRKAPDVEYRTEYNDAEDLDHWARHCMKFQVANIPKPLYHWRINPEGITHSRVAKQQEASKRVRDYYQAWYLTQTTTQLPPMNEIRIERNQTGRVVLWNRKRALMKLFRKHRRPELIRREWRYLFSSML